MISRAFRVPDANIDVWKTVWAMSHGAQQRGARILTYHEAIDVHRSSDRVTGARVRDARTGEELDIEAQVTVNAGGAWAGRIADMAGIEGVRVLPGRGIMIAMNHRLVNTVINRCQLPTDGDILVPIRTVSVIGTTDQHTEDPDDHTVAQDEVDRMLDDGEKLVPGFRQARALRVWTGVRPLFEDAKESDTDTRDVTRAHALLDHEQRDGVRGFVTITGGKLTTYRMMAEETVDAVCKHLGEVRPCTTKTEPLPGSESGANYRLGERLARKEAALLDEQVICECELVSRSRLEEAIKRSDSVRLDDIRRQLRLGMGPCQGGICNYRATGLLHGIDKLSAETANQALLDFMQERWKGTGRFCTATSCARSASTIGCSRACSTSSTRRASVNGAALAALSTAAVARSRRCRPHEIAAALRRGRDRRRDGRTDRRHAAGAGRRQGRGAGQGPRFHPPVARHDRRARLHPGASHLAT